MKNNQIILLAQYKNNFQKMMNSAEAVKTAPLSSVQKIDSEKWTEVIEPQSRLLNLRLKEIWRYRDLIIMFVRRDFVANYKQTILGPIWFFLQPLLTTLTFVLVFGRVAGLSTDGLPMLAFYLSGVTIWNYFSETLNKTATVFRDNAQVFGKVYFPRIAMPISIVISNLVRFLIQFSLFIVVWIYYLMNDESIHPNAYVLLIPFLVLMMGVLALGFGMLVSSLTTKYRDLIFLLTFGIQLLMYATPVIYPLSSIPENYKWLILLNPMTSVVETFRYALLGTGIFNWLHITYSLILALVVLLIGMVVFNKIEKSFTDTV